MASRTAYTFQRRDFWIAVEDRIDVLDDVSVYVEEVPLVLDRNQRSLGSIVHRYLKRLDEGAKRLEVALKAHVTEDHQRRGEWRVAYRGESRDKEADADLRIH